MVKSRGCLQESVGGRIEEGKEAPDSGCQQSWTRAVLSFANENRFQLKSTPKLEDVVVFWPQSAHSWSSERNRMCRHIWLDSSGYLGNALLKQILSSDEVIKQS